MQVDYLIIGAGPTGLGAARRLAELGCRSFAVLEKNAYAGGLAASFKDDKGYTWDIGGHVAFSHYEYFDRLLDVQLRSDWQGWMRFFAQAVMLACTEALDTTQALTALRETWRAAVSDQRSDSASRRLVELLVGQPVVTVAEVSQRLGVSFPTANHALAALVQRGIVPGPASPRNRLDLPIQ